MFNAACHVVPNVIATVLLPPRQLNRVPQTVPVDAGPVVVILVIIHVNQSVSLGVDPDVPDAEIHVLMDA